MKNYLIAKKILKIVVPIFLLTTINHQIIAQSKTPTSDRFEEVKKRILPELVLQLEGKNLTLGSQIFIRIFKETNELELWMEKERKFTLFKTYDICTYGSEGLGPKLKEGDGKAPEGFYYVLPSRMNPQSDFHLSFNIGFPNKYDIAKKRSGSYIMVHGACCSIGCYAMTDESIEEIYTIADYSLNNGHGYFSIHIFPFKMTEEKMAKYKDSEWIHFWQNLKEGYDLFEQNLVPPNVEVNKENKYVFD